MTDRKIIAAPDWLELRNGEFRRGVVEGSWLVLFSGSPQYRLETRPAKGKFTCAVVQSNNGRRIDKGIEYPDANAALAGGLDELRQALGW
jgi:hypothetical protein